MKIIIIYYENGSKAEINEKNSGIFDVWSLPVLLEVEFKLKFNH
jgi:hypothetical protein